MKTINISKIIFEPINSIEFAENLGVFGFFENSNWLSHDDGVEFKESFPIKRTIITLEGDY